MTTAKLAEHRARLNAEGFSLAMDSFGRPMPMEYLPAEWRSKGSGVSSMAQDMGLDAQPTLSTAPNAGIPALFTTYIDPKRIKTLFTPLKAAEFYGETRLGKWTDDTLQFPRVETTGYVSSYGDFSQNGVSGYNANWISRQTWSGQTNIRWGSKEAERYGEGMIDWAAGVAESAGTNIARGINNAYFYGVSGLKLYGGINDPALPSAISPNTKAAGGLTWAVGTTIEIYNDFLTLYTQLQTQLPALVDMGSRMVCGIPNTLEPYLARTNDFGKTVREIILQSFPNVRFVVIPQFVTQSGNLIQLRLEDVDGQEVCTSVFTEKLRLFPVITLASGWEQKQAFGVAGTVIKMPVAFVQMLGA